jgi:hypothetical protein
MLQVTWTTLTSPSGPLRSWPPRSGASLHCEPRDISVFCTWELVLALIYPPHYPHPGSNCTLSCRQYREVPCTYKPVNPAPKPANPTPIIPPPPGAVPPGTRAACTDQPPNSQYTCAQQKQWGKCSASWMTSGNFCAKTCGRC